MRAFEMHTFRESQWKVDSVFDDRELAIHEARKIDENYDEASDLTTTRTNILGKNEAAESKTPKSTGKKNHRWRSTRRQ